MYKLAIVEDVPDNRFILHALLERHFEVTEFEGGKRFIEALPESDFDLVLLDISMPGLDGFEVLKYMQDHPFYSGIPVIAVTANAMEGDREKALAAGFWDYVTKPFEFDELVDCIDRRLDESRRYKARRA